MLLGGARSGKSALAVELAGKRATYVATAVASDDEMAARIERHRAERPPAWTTVEEPVALGVALAAVEGDAVVDCLSLWVSNLMEAGWEDEAIEDEARAIARAAAARPGMTVAVSNEVGSGVVPATPLGRRYRDVLGGVNRAWATEADRALLVVAGRALELERI